MHRQVFDVSQVKQTVEEMSIDGGKVQLRTPLGEACQWRDYKVVNLQEQSVAAFFQDNLSLVNWVNVQPRNVDLSGCKDSGKGRDKRKGRRVNKSLTEKIHSGTPLGSASLNDSQKRCRVLQIIERARTARYFAFSHC